MDWTYFLEDQANGQDVVVYVVDTGAMSAHPELSKRVLPVGSAYIMSDVGGTTEDLDGHGTAVAGIIAGLSVGVANEVTIIPIKILTEYDDLLTDTGSHTLSIPDDRLKQAISLATKHYMTERGGKGSAIINVSITAWKDAGLEAAIKAAIAAGIHVVAAAGNNGLPENKSQLGADICADWIGNVGQITVGATTIEDKMATFSNFGKCVDVYGPGESIISASLDGKTAPDDGTSFATPHVSGMIAAILSSMGPMTPAAMKAKILADAKGKVVDIAKYPNSNNRLVMFNPSMLDLLHL
ncbi:peptidase S8/S53 domain-containing protein [Mycena crocata]|nr:peptidase S8/S53 domain-containing protein [Mycena crocata]